MSFKMMMHAIQAQSKRQQPRDDSMAQPIDKSLDESHPTERIEIDKIQLPEGLNQEAVERDSSLFRNEPSFAYEKSMVQQAQDKFGAPSPDPSNNGKEGRGRPESIIDKYKDRIAQQKVDPSAVVLNPVNEPATKEERKQLRRQQTIKKRNLQREIDALREDVDEWGDRMDKVASVSRLTLMLTITVLVAIMIFFLIREFGNNKFVIWIVLEFCDEGIIVGLSLMTLRMLGITEPDAASIHRFRIWLYTAIGLHCAMLVLGFALMDYSVSLNMGAGTSTEQSKALYGIMGIAYIVLGFGKFAIHGYWLYLYRGYRPCYDKFYNKTMEDPLAAPTVPQIVVQPPVSAQTKSALKEQEQDKPRSKAEEKTESKSSDKQ